jgi:hypothetical protein
MVIIYLRLRSLQSDTDIPRDNHPREHLKTNMHTLWILDTQSQSRPLQLLEIVNGFRIPSKGILERTKLDPIQRCTISLSSCLFSLHL